MSSPVLPTTVISASVPVARRWCSRPRVKRAPPMPPASTVMRMRRSVTRVRPRRGGHPQRPRCAREPGDARAQRAGRDVRSARDERRRRARSPARSAACPRGVAVDVDEATALLHARGAGARRAAGPRRRGPRPRAGERRSTRRRHVQPQGVHPADAAVPRPLPLLHVRDRPGVAAPRRARPVPEPRRGARHRPRRAPRSGARRRCSPSATGPRTGGRQAREWLDAHGYDDTLVLRPRDGRSRVLEETGLLPHLNPGVMSWEEIARLKPVAPSMGMMLETSAERLWSEPGGRALRQPGQGARGAAAGARRRRSPVGARSPPASSSASARRRASASSRCSPSGTSPASTGTCRR